MSRDLKIVDNNSIKSIALILNGAVASKIDIDIATASIILNGPTAVDITHLSSEISVGDLFDIETASFTKVVNSQTK
jgi:molybdopterin-binding protein